MKFSRIFVGILLLLSIIILPPFVYASNNKLSSPLMQFNNGTSTQNIICSNDLELIYKSTNDYPACVKHQTAQILLQHGWGVLQPVSYLIKVDRFLVPYNITAGDMLKANREMKSTVVIFSIHTKSDGVLSVKIPRSLIDVKSPNGQEDGRFVVLVDGQDADFQEIKTTETHRTLAIPFTGGSEQIEIISATY